MDFDEPCRLRDELEELILVHRELLIRQAAILTAIQECCDDEVKTQIMSVANGLMKVEG